MGTKLEHLQEQINEIKKEMEALKEQVFPSKWVKVSEAAKVLGIHPETIKKRIRQAKQNPKDSPYKKGFSWRGDTIYFVNIEAWEKVYYNLKN